MKLFDKVIELSRPVQELVLSIKQLAQGLEKVAQSVTVIAQNQAAQHRMITHMHLVQQIVMKRMSEGGIDTSLPDIDASDKVSSKKSN